LITCIFLLRSAMNYGRSWNKNLPLRFKYVTPLTHYLAKFECLTVLQNWSFILAAIISRVFCKFILDFSLAIVLSAVDTIQSMATASDKLVAQY